jgi:hypothetical protein
MSEDSRFWLGVLLFVLLCSRLMYGLWVWACVPTERFKGVFSPELTALHWMYARLEHIRLACETAFERRRAARHRAREEQRALATIRVSDKEQQRPNLNLVACPDCGASISSRAEACPHCGCPMAKPPVQRAQVQSGRRACPYCGSYQVGRVRGLQGLGEVITFIVLFFLCVLPGVIYYIYMESVPYCSGCGRRGGR